MQQITIEIVTNKGATVLQNLLEKNLSEIVSGERSKLFDDGSQIELSDNYAPSESFGLYETIPIVLGFIGGVASKVLASWIYDKLKRSDERIKITYRGGRTIPLEDAIDLFNELNKILQFEASSSNAKSKRKKRK